MDVYNAEIEPILTLTEKNILDKDVVHICIGIIFYNHIARISQCSG